MQLHDIYDASVEQLQEAASTVQEQLLHTGASCSPPQAASLQTLLEAITDELSERSASLDLYGEVADLFRDLEAAHPGMLEAPADEAQVLSALSAPLYLTPSSPEPDLPGSLSPGAPAGAPACVSASSRTHVPDAASAARSDEDAEPRGRDLGSGPSEASAESARASGDSLWQRSTSLALGTGAIDGHDAPLTRSDEAREPMVRASINCSATPGRAPMHEAMHEAGSEISPSDRARASASDADEQDLYTRGTAAQKLKVLEIDDCWGAEARDSSPAPPKLSALEAARLAYKSEQQTLARARRALLRGSKEAAPRTSPTRSERRSKAVQKPRVPAFWGSTAASTSSSPERPRKRGAIFAPESDDDTEAQLRREGVGDADVPNARRGDVRRAQPCVASQRMNANAKQADQALPASAAAQDARNAVRLEGRDVGVRCSTEQDAAEADCHRSTNISWVNLDPCAEGEPDKDASATVCESSLSQPATEPPSAVLCSMPIQSEVSKPESAAAHGDDVAAPIFDESGVVTRESSPSPVQTWVACDAPEPHQVEPRPLLRVDDSFDEEEWDSKQLQSRRARLVEAQAGVHTSQRVADRSHTTVVALSDAGRMDLDTWAQWSLAAALDESEGAHDVAEWAKDGAACAQLATGTSRRVLLQPRADRSTQRHGRALLAHCEKGVATCSAVPETTFAGAEITEPDEEQDGCGTPSEARPHGDEIELHSNLSSTDTAVAAAPSGKEAECTECVARCPAATPRDCADGADCLCDSASQTPLSQEGQQAAAARAEEGGGALDSAYDHGSEEPRGRQVVALALEDVLPELLSAARTRLTTPGQTPGAEANEKPENLQTRSRAGVALAREQGNNRGGAVLSRRSTSQPEPALGAPRNAPGAAKPAIVFRKPTVLEVSRSMIPCMPPVYTPCFPQFDAVTSMFWRFNATPPPLVPKRARTDADSVFIADVLDNAIPRCTRWFDRHRGYGPDSACTQTLSPAAANPAPPHSAPGTIPAPTRATFSLTMRPPTTTRTQPAPAPRTAPVQGAISRSPMAPSQAAHQNLPDVAVPGWVPQLPSGLARQRFFRIVTNQEHPEVATLLKGCLEELGWVEDREGPHIVSCRDDDDLPSAEVTRAATSGDMVHMWNLLWTWTSRIRVPESELLMWQRVNHFQECRNLTRKDLLKQHMERHAAMFSTSRHLQFFRCLPTTFTLPKEFAAFERAFAASAASAVSSTAAAGRHAAGAEEGKERASGKASAANVVSPQQKRGLNVWILKPSCLSRGRGIYLVDDLAHVVCSQPSVIQRYVTNPLLLRGHKFDLRLYVVVTSFNPLEAFIYKEGFARVALEPYTNAPAQLGNLYVHLTNASIQAGHAFRCMPDFLQPTLKHPDGGSKVSLTRLWELLAERDISQKQLWPSIQHTALAALYSAQDAIPHQVNSFELFGVDVIIDEDLKVWLLEVNSSPSLGLDTPLDQVVKRALVRDLVQLVDPLPFDRVAMHGILKRRKAQRMGPDRLSRRQGGGLLAGTAAEEKEILNADLHAILKGGCPRSVDEDPTRLGNFERLAPCSLLMQFDRMKK